VRKLLVIGIGAGDPEHVTVQAIKALNEADECMKKAENPASAGLS
jgi:precorrin-6A synthase